MYQLFFALLVLTFSRYALPQLKKGLYAVLVKGPGKELSFDNDIKLAYYTLIESGVEKENIFIFSDIENDPNLLNLGVKTKKFNLKSFNKSIGSISKSIGAGKFLFFLSGHGNPSKAGVDLYGFNGISAKELNKIIENNLPKKNEKIIIIDSCYSGNFVKECGNSERIIITGSPTIGLAFETDNESYGELSYHFFSALRGKYPNNQAINADFDNDGRVSFKEAFDFAVKSGKASPVNLKEFIKDPTGTFLQLLLGLDYDPRISCPKNLYNSTICSDIERCNNHLTGLDSLLKSIIPIIVKIHE